MPVLDRIIDTISNVFSIFISKQMIAPAVGMALCVLGIMYLVKNMDKNN